MALEVRRARLKHLPAMKRMLALASAGEESLSPLRIERLLRELTRYPQYHCYIGVWNGEPVGFFTLLVVPTLGPEGRAATVNPLFVAPEWRGRGIGGAMMAEAMRIAAHAGCDTLSVTSRLDDSEAQHFYRSLGFRQHGASFWIDMQPRSDPRVAARNLCAPSADRPSL